MLCGRCKNNNAQVHYTSVVNGQETSADLCLACAQSAGLMLSTGEGMNFPSLPPALAELFGMLSTWPARPAAASIARYCPHCKWTLDRFQKTGLMGCPDCYANFRPQARTVVERIHGTAHHRGRKPPAPHAEKPKGREKPRSGPEIRQQLDAAIREERFEEAAVLRDMLRRLEVGE